MSLVAAQGGRLLEVERLALREVLARRHVEEDDVAELFLDDEAGELAADVSRADECNLAFGHLILTCER